MFEDRKREWIQKPQYCGCPISWATKFFQGKLFAFRKEHPQFDAFLKEIGEMIKDKKSRGYQKLIKFINGEPETNWVCTNNSIFSVFVDLFNLCLSPKQAVKYIQKCHQVYLKMLLDKYSLYKEYEIELFRSHYDGVAKKHVKAYVLPNNKENYSYRITISPLQLDFNDLILSSNVEIKLLSSDPIYQYALSLFEYYSYEKLPRSALRNVYNATMYSLQKYGVFEYIGKEEHHGDIEHKYNVVGDVGLHILDKKSA